MIRLPRIANFDDFAPLAAETGVSLRYVNSREALGTPCAVILPGTKSTIADLLWLRDQGLDRAIQALAARGTAVIGICGGYQMLGRSLHDPERVESDLPHTHGMGLLPVDTVFVATKATHQVEARVLDGPGWLASLTGETIRGYEIHMGHTVSPQPWLTITQRSGTPISLADGTTAATGRVWGCYLHGLFENVTLRHAWLASLGWNGAHGAPQGADGLQTALDTLADHVEASLDMTQLERIVWGN